MADPADAAPTVRPKRSSRKVIDYAKFNIAGADALANEAPPKRASSRTSTSATKVPRKRKQSEVQPHGARNSTNTLMLAPETASQELGVKFANVQATQPSNSPEADAQTNEGVAADQPPETKRQKTRVSIQRGRTKVVGRLSGSPKKLDQRVLKVEETHTQTTKPIKAPNYGIKAGVSPYPDWPGPTEDQCREVHRLLSDFHGELEQPEIIPQPRLDVTGCGEVKSVTDALLRTRLSAATTVKNSNNAMITIVRDFGIAKDGVGEGSIDWNAVRLEPREKLFNSIKSGGLATTKSATIKEILDMIASQNGERRAKLLEEGKTLTLADEDPISLEYLKDMDTEKAYEALIQYPAIGPKTAACVLLFCLKRPCFAVDTHVHRLSKWLGWVPAKATEIKTFAHCQTKVPDDLKYPLHQLFFTHGRNCYRCQANTSKGSKLWEEKECVIEHLVNRIKKVDVKKAMKGTVEGNESEKTEPPDDEETQEMAGVAAIETKRVSKRPGLRSSQSKDGTAVEVKTEVSKSTGKISKPSKPSRRGTNKRKAADAGLDEPPDVQEGKENAALLVETNVSTELISGSSNAVTAKNQENEGERRSSSDVYVTADEIPPGEDSDNHGSSKDASKLDTAMPDVSSTKKPVTRGRKGGRFQKSSGMATQPKRASVAGEKVLHQTAANSSGADVKDGNLAQKAKMNGKQAPKKIKDHKSSTNGPLRRSTRIGRS